MLQGHKISFNIYAEDEMEVTVARHVISEFIAENAREGRAVTAKRLTEALRLWRNNAFIRNAVSRFLSE